MDTGIFAGTSCSNRRRVVAAPVVVEVALELGILDEPCWDTRYRRNQPSAVVVVAVAADDTASIVDTAAGCSIDAAAAGIPSMASYAIAAEVPMTAEAVADANADVG